MQRLVHQTEARARGVLADLLQTLFAAELVLPSSRLFVISPWIGDVPVVDNRAGRLSALDARWGARIVRLSDVLRTLLLAGTVVHLACRPGESQDRFVERLVAKATSDGTAGNIRLARPDAPERDRQHQKAIVADTWALFGSMNLTYNGIELNGELVSLTVDEAQIAALAAELSSLFAASG